MEYNINLSTLQNKKTTLETVNSEVTSKVSNINGSLGSLSSSQISGIIGSTVQELTRLDNACKNCNEWFTSYLNDLDSAENALASSAEGIISFAGSFENLFAKVTMPTLMTGGDARANIITSEHSLLGIHASDYNNPDNISGSHLDFINSIKDGAVEAYNKYGVLPSLTLAQAILESGWGDHSIGNNIFGIKAGGSWTGKVQNCLTSEQNDDGSYYQIYADFRDYDSIDDSIVDHAKLLTTERYKPVIASSNYVEACQAVRACGYATSLDYSQNLINLVEQYGLDQWDPH